MIDPKRVFELMRQNIADVNDMLSNNEEVTITIQKDGKVCIDACHKIPDSVVERMSYSVVDDGR